MNSGCLYTDADNIREHPTSKLLSVVANGKMLDGKTGVDIPLLTYQARGDVVPLNDWDDPSFFPAAFPTLFPTGMGGHISDNTHSRTIAVSIEMWAKWALDHHSRR